LGIARKFIERIEKRMGPNNAHSYEKQVTYRVLVKAIDIFGNDSSQVFEVE